ncbi:hypothetical protein DRN43_03275 [Thermococci archaeon]|uniref:endonuclease NucS domain-containing protein n=1 Tax=Palaeococcus sp. (in: euryarchaeotes) TaxID=2820298 RepID=UPI000F1DB911|nr:endonuclease NucS domain-containing protein [Palaeococcus sp. (in: euryarchaeotes)]MCD6559931.1 DUF91 domain-containing protein [Palaeococcus sp. (in: euryarchaeotes)]RLF74971.1 MAG: hypothetical protein DRN39_07885 [Thermococci archaeon]RLF89667.1 MAG: hypothetical protein DRN43_03275 [Thermococci archaeon]
MPMMDAPSYFLISVSNRENLELCLKYRMAGFTNSINGFWTFLDIKEGDYISFLYGARVRNLYKVVRKVVYKNAENLPPWQPVKFKQSGKTYYFPFRLYLKQERILDEPMIRPEFAYVAENLLLRGGYRKTHFQADTVTFYNVSNMGESFKGEHMPLDIDADTFIPKIVFKRDKQKIPEKYHFHELILQALVRKKLQDVLDGIVEYFGLNHRAEEFEILGEKALPEGYVDIFIKLKHPVGENRYLLAEVKRGKAQNKDLKQLKIYLSEFKNEAVGGILIAKDFPKRKRSVERNILMIKYSFESLNPNEEYAYEDLLERLQLDVLSPR